MRAISENRGLARLGDALLELLNVVGIEAGYLNRRSRVTNEMLRRVSVRTGVRRTLRKRLNRGEVGDAIEAAVAHWFIRGELSWASIMRQMKARGELEDALVAEIKAIEGEPDA